MNNRRKATAQTYLRELLKEIKDASYLAQDGELFEECCTTLKEVRDKLNSSIPREDNLPLEPSPKAKKSLLRFKPYNLPCIKRRVVMKKDTRSQHRK